MNVKTTATIMFVVLQLTSSNPAKNNARPVYEVINEQREEKKVNPGPVTFGNPLAGHSIQNAKLYAQNQQAMFNAERVRQHKAQLQRWTKSPQQDSYMKAYHESEESHQLAVEKEQSDLKTPTKRQDRRRGKENGPTEKTRSHRSHGSLDYQYVPRYKTVYVSPGTTYDQGVTIKPNGIAYVETDENKLYTEAVPSKTQYVHPKDYSHAQNYETSDIATLNALLEQNPQDQLTNFNAMLHANENKEHLQTPVELFFYNNANNVYHPTNGGYTSYAPNAYTQETRYKDHTPIKEDLDDIEDPNKHTTVKNYGVQPTTNLPDEDSTIPYYNNAGPTTQRVVEEKPKYQAVKYEKLYPFQDSKDSESGIYMHHNTENQGVHRLNQDGVEVSAYDDAEVSIIRNRRSILDTEPFILNDTVNRFESNKTATNKTIDIEELLPVAEELKQPISLKHFKRVPYDFVSELETPTDTDYYDDGEDDYDYEPEFDYTNDNRSPIFVLPNKNPSSDLTASFSNKRHSSWKSPPSYGPNLNDFSTSYGVPYQIYDPEYGVPSFDPSKFHSHSYEFPSELKEPVYVLTETQLKSLIGHHNLNVQHSDFHQWGKEKRKHRPRKYRRRPYSHVPKRIKKNLYKLHKIAALQYAANYEFGYRVRDHHTGNYYGHHEAKKDGKTNGHYHVLLPDGRMQKVKYTAGPDGFHADISYDNMTEH
ncbi:cuticular protein RR-2 motif 143 [Bombyx mori]|uniref:Putative cuticle protein n=1 Tax=Bombyx mori TaxID=7091 RepID=C0H6Y5_BOMMO|nr:cuticular protein RR-2 motif 143 [Bombyx mori]FAA00646.1 TPA: putative cuticle protein [Bombyx mori]